MTGVARGAVDGFTVMEGGAALKAVGKAVLSEAGAGVASIMSNTARVGSASVDRLAQQSAASASVATSTAAAATASVGKGLIASASSPDANDGGFQLRNLVPFSGAGRDIQKAKAACNP